MTEANKNTIKSLAAIIGGFTLFVLFAIYVPDYSILKKIVAALMTIFLLGAVIWYTPLSNPLRKLYQKWKGNK